MEKVCAWCAKGISLEPGNGKNGVSHGICDSCREYFFSRKGPPTFDDFIDRLPAPVIVVDQDCKIVTANDMSCRMLGREREAMSGALLGNAVECSYARLPEGCGRSTHCRSCAIRLTVLDTYATGRSHYNVPAYNDLSFHKRERSVCYLISTEKSGDFVYLRIIPVEGGECEQDKAA